MDFHFIDKVIGSGPDRFKGRLQFFQIPAGTPICDIPKGIIGRVQPPILAYRIGYALGLHLAGGLVWLLIVILDEATAFTDQENEEKIQQSIAALTKGKTLLVIAHRLSTIKNADQIIVLQNGQVENTGTHQQLLDGDALYTHLLHFYDDGISGVTMERPGFQAMLAQIEQGKASAVFVKDYCAIIGLNQKDLENQGILA